MFYSDNWHRRAGLHLQTFAWDLHSWAQEQDCMATCCGNPTDLQCTSHGTLCRCFSSFLCPLEGVFWVPWHSNTLKHYSSSVKNVHLGDSYNLCVYQKELTALCSHNGIYCFILQFVNHKVFPKSWKRLLLCISNKEWKSEINPEKIMYPTRSQSKTHEAWFTVVNLCWNNCINLGEITVTH